ncbi:hypothetical protein [Bradyrhizobium tunisiense]|uniref:hypothetical protein n=1 Tax=Bradyrhizobium tunisiense TaxID=3278709 RepID=UPI0035DE8966
MKASRFKSPASAEKETAIAIADFIHVTLEHSGHFQILVAPTGLKRLGAMIGLSGSGSRWSNHLALTRIWP